MFISLRCFKIKILKQLYTPSTPFPRKKWKQLNIIYMFFLGSTFEFHRTSKVSKHCSIIRFISAVFTVTYVWMFEVKYWSMQTHQNVLFVLFLLSNSINLYKCHFNLPISHFQNIAYKAKLLKIVWLLIMIYRMNQQNTDF